MERTTTPTWTSMHKLGGLAFDCLAQYLAHGYSKGSVLFSAIYIIWSARDGDRTVYYHMGELRVHKVERCMEYG
jgi:hypothetical protein